MGNSLICAQCPLYACRVCRTKTGWRHQSWCGLANVAEPRCEECRYYSLTKKACTHPARGKGGTVYHEKAQYSL